VGGEGVNPNDAALSRPAFHFPFCGRQDYSSVLPGGIEVGRHVSVFKIDPGTGERLGLLATASVGKGGLVGLDKPMIVRAGEAFIVVQA
jgi:hypothetical protein